MEKASWITLAGSIAGAIALAYGVRGDYPTAARLLLLSYIIDQLDGLCARRCGSDPQGALLDRAVDRINQVVIPSVILLLMANSSRQYALYSAYVAVLIPYSLYRLAYRDSSKTGYYTGAPLFLHALVITLPALTGQTPPVIVLFLLLILSIAPIRHWTGRGGTANRVATITILTAIAVSPPVIIEKILWIIYPATIVAALAPLFLGGPSPPEPGSQH